MSKLTPYEQRLAVQLLRDAAEEFGNHGCNDFNVVERANLTPDECEELHKRMAIFNGAPDEASSGPIFMDWYLYSYLSHRLSVEETEDYARLKDENVRLRRERDEWEQRHQAQRVEVAELRATPSPRALEMIKRAAKIATAEVRRHLEMGRAVYGRRDGKPFWLRPTKK